MRTTSFALLAGAALVLAACGPTSSTLPPDSGVPGGGGSGGGGGQHDGGGSDAGSGTDGGADTPTWYKDVLPIVQTSCQGCHVEGGIAPFALEAYADGQAMSGAMADAVAQKRMPPWMPDPACNSYQNERRLTQAEIDTIVAWANGGAPEGDVADAPPPPEAQVTLPWVDATLDSGVDYTPSTSAGTDDYHCFVVDPALASAKDVIGFDILPGQRQEVHHVLLYSADADDAKAKDDETPGPGWTCFGGPGTPNPQVVGAWAPGSPATQFPQNTGVHLATGTVFVMQIHYNTSTTAPVPDRTSVKLQYAKSTVRPAYIIPQAEASFLIPPMSAGYSTQDTETASPVNLTVYGVLPHMHTLGRRIQVTTSMGACLVDIPAWDFHWQQFYFFKEPYAYSAGEQRILSCTWDNPTAQSVTWGEGTSDEMCLDYVYVTIP